MRDFNGFIDLNSCENFGPGLYKLRYWVKSAQLNVEKVNTPSEEAKLEWRVGLLGIKPYFFITDILAPSRVEAESRARKKIVELRKGKTYGLDASGTKWRFVNDIPVPSGVSDV